jgi:hypothetical protein
MEYIKAMLIVVMMQLTIICWHLRFIYEEIKNKEHDGNGDVG